MLQFDTSFERQLALNTWPMYGVGAGFFAIRCWARVSRLGIRRLQADDYIMVFAFLCYTGLCVCLNRIASGGGSNLFPPEQAASFDQHEIEERAKGSKIVLISEQFMLNTIYLIKACLLIMYNRLTTGLKQHKLVKAIAVWVACGWVATEFTYFFACRPFNQYWAVPPRNPECTIFKTYAITQAVFNISADLMMLAIMLPVLVKANLALKQKVALLIIFGMGSFVIVAAILTKVFNLSDVYSTVYMLWYFREASVAMYVSNLPMIWPLVRDWFDSLNKMTSHRDPTYGSTSSAVAKSKSNGKGGAATSAVPLSPLSKGSGRHALGGHHHHQFGMETDINPSESAERINRPSFPGRGIYTETTVAVMYDEDEDDDRASSSAAPATANSNFDLERNAPLRRDPTSNHNDLQYDEKPALRPGLQRPVPSYSATSSSSITRAGSPSPPSHSRDSGPRAL